MTTMDEKVLQLLDVVNKQKQEVEILEQETKKSWVTNCSFPAVFGSSLQINIQTQNEKSILQLQSDLMIQTDYLKKAADLLGIEFDGKWGTFAIEDWTKDFKKRIAIIQIKSKKDKLKDLESRLNDLVSPEQRRALELEAISNSLGI